MTDASPQAGQRKRSDRHNTVPIRLPFIVIQLLVTEGIHCILPRGTQGRVESTDTAAQDSH